MKYNYIIFDLDGTLLNTLDDLRDSTNFALRRFGFPERTTDEVRRFVGNGVARLIHLAVPEGTDEKTEADCLAVFKAHYKDNMTNRTLPGDNGAAEKIASSRSQDSGSLEQIRARRCRAVRGLLRRTR